MAITAHLEVSDAIADSRSSPRRALRFETLGARSTGDGQAVLVHNASATGLLLESKTQLAIGETIDIDLPQAGITPAQVVWTSGVLYGCRFEAPITAATLAAAQLRSDAPIEARALPPVAHVPESFGSRFRRLRKQKRLTLAQLGDILDVSKPTVWAWENGKSRPLAGRIAAIAAALGVGEDDLIGLHGDLEADELIARSREDIARAFGIEPGKVRIMIEI